MVRRLHPSLTLEPIGVAHTPFTEKRMAPRQPSAARGVEGTLELYPGRDFEHALDDLGEWSHVWVLYWFDRVEGWRPKVLPPRVGAEGEKTTRKGVFSTRSPHRPNPIGLSVLRLLSVDGLVLRVSDVDLLDGTPILDVKPYVKYTDIVPDASDGWLAPRDPRPSWEVQFEEHARAQLAFLLDQGVDLEPPITQSLALGPQPHPYRRIRADGDGFVLAHKEWRVRFCVEGRVVRVASLASGYRPKELEGNPALELHRELTRRFR